MNNQLLKIIVCPICYTELLINTKATELICNVDNIVFPIKEGIPILLKKEIKC